MKWKRGPAILIILFSLIAFTWFMLDQVSASNPLSDLLSVVTSPLQYFVDSILPSPGGSSHPFESEESIRARLAEAEDEIARLRTQVILLQEAEIENEELRAQLAYKNTSPNYELLSAQVIGRDPVGELDYLVVDRGSQDGLEEGMPVVAPEGLVGRVSRVTRTSSQVMLVTDSSSAVTSLIQRSRVSGLVSGAPGHHLLMNYVSQDADVEEGDIVLTSGLGSSFPKGLVVGQIIGVSRQDIDMFLTAELVPAVKLADLESVMVITSFDAEALTELEAD